MAAGHPLALDGFNQAAVERASHSPPMQRRSWLRGGAAGASWAMAEFNTAVTGGFRS